MSAKAYTREEWARQMVEEFRQDVSDKLANSGNIQITDAAYIDRLNSDTIRYRGDTWQLDGGVPNKDIAQMYLHNTKTLDHIRNLESLTASAKYNTTYWLKVFELFKAWLDEHGKKEPAQTTQAIKEKPYIYIIDEINRANLPAVLGELIYALEYRDTPVKCLYALETGEDSITIPSNLYIIGTMNTADRSTGHLDYAIRRRFSFCDAVANPDIIKNEKARKLYDEVVSLFLGPEGEPSQYLHTDFEPHDVIPGHSYYLAADDRVLALKLQYDLLPILKEYVRDGILTELPQTKVQAFYDAIANR
jgi:hypothetical protein